MKKKSIWIISIFTLFVFLFVIWYFLGNPEITKEEVISLTQKVTQYNNYKMEQYQKTDEGISKITFFKKDSIVVIKSSNSTIWINYQTKEKIDLLHKTNPVALISKVEEDSYSGMQLQKLEDPEYKYQFLRQESYFGRDCLVISLKSKENKEYEEVYIQKETGMVVHKDNYKLDEKGKIQRQIYREETSILFNTVVEQDVQKPDLTGYEVIYL